MTLTTIQVNIFAMVTVVSSRAETAVEEVRVFVHTFHVVQDYLLGVLHSPLILRHRRFLLFIVQDIVNRLSTKKQSEMFQVYQLCFKCVVRVLVNIIEL